MWCPLVLMAGWPFCPVRGEAVTPSARMVDPMSDQSKRRAFCIVAHVDHGKSTLADRFLEMSGAVDARDMRAQFLDSMDIERERGITIKAQNVKIPWKGHDLFLIDT